MTVPLSPGSPRRAAATRFGAELGRAMKARGIGAPALSEQLGIAKSAIARWRAGDNLPRLETAQRLASGLGSPRLVEIVREARGGTCERCGAPFSMQGGKPKRFCSATCRDARRPVVVGPPPADAIEQARTTLLGEVMRVGAPRKQVIGRAVTLIDVATGTATARRLTDHIGAVAAFCAGCEPEGLCRDADCPLRPVSPLPLANRDDDAVPVQRPLGRWGQPGAREAFSEDLRQRHAAHPEWAESTRERTRRRWASMTPEERAATGKLISERRGRAATASQAARP